ncbi:BlaI/MecI/CopY family transcriptional regulator [Frankia sp. Cas3]|uniref:BlaI/MecI/CopY family transcriptional regulator n=1 Tax=Frankia sp. Cas3 TaxID=3073926 RepID=UPI002AD30C6E|nr:BlaI/MecI/CopY family transcriptional regulator [Frankia sp. Cas3]
MGDRSESRRARRARGALESEVLAALWASDEPVTPAAIQQSLGGDLAYTTVTTILTRLAEKGLAERIPTGRGYAWRAVAAREELAARQMKTLLTRGETPTAVLQRFVEQLSPAEGAVLRSLLAAQTLPVAGPPAAGPHHAGRSDGGRGGA